MGEQSPLSLMPLPRSKSQIFTGETWGWTGIVRAPHIPSPLWLLEGEGRARAWVGGAQTAHLVGVLTQNVLWLQVPVGNAWEVEWGVRVVPLQHEAGRRPQPTTPLLCRKSRALATSCTTTLASSSLK